MNIYLRFCEQCGDGYDIGINFSICPVCRLKKLDARREEEIVRNKLKEDEEYEEENTRIN